MLPGKGLAQHDFCVFGRVARAERIFIVRGGKVVWSYEDPAGKGEISDMVMLLEWQHSVRASVWADGD